MELVKQEPSAFACLSMITGKTIDPGKRKTISTKQMHEVLKSHNIESGEKLTIVGKAVKHPFPYRGILKVTFFDVAKRINSRVIQKQYHWVVINYPYIFDPLKGKTKVADYLIMINELKGRVTSFLKVEF